MSSIIDEQDKQLLTEAVHKLYDEYTNIDEGSIKSLRLSPIDKKKILES